MDTNLLYSVQIDRKVLHIENIKAVFVEVKPE
jgi:hypothetical protein